MSFMENASRFETVGIHDLTSDELEVISGGPLPVGFYIGVWVAGQIAVRAAPYVAGAAAAVATYVTIDQAAHN